MTQLGMPSTSRGLLTSLPRHQLEEGMFYVSDNLQLFEGQLGFAPGSSKYINQVLTGNAIMLTEKVIRPDGLTRLAVWTTSKFYFENPPGTFTDRTRRLGVPAAPSLAAQTSGGALGAGTYGVVLTHITAEGETTQSAETTQVVVGAGNDDRIVVTVPALPTYVTSYGVYATSTPGSNWHLIGTTAGPTFNINSIGAGAAPPAGNTAYVSYTGSISTPWTTDVGANVSGPFIWYLATNGVDAVQKWGTNTGGSAGPQDLGGSPTDAGRHFSKSIAVFYACLFHLNRTENGTQFPTKLMWSDAGLVETYVGGIASSLTLFQGGFDEGVLILPIGPYLAAYRKNSIHLISFTGTPFFFSQRQVVLGVGLQAPRGALHLDTKHLFLGQDNVYLFNGVDIQPIANDIRSQLFASIDPSNIFNSFWLYDRLRNIAALVTPSVNSAGIPDTWWYFNLTSGGWSGPSVGRQATGGGNWTRTTSLTWADMTMAWKDAATTWKGAGAIAGAPVVLYGNTACIVYYVDPTTVLLDGASVTARFETRSVNPGSMMQPQAIETICTELIPLVSSAGGALIQWSVGVSDSPQGPFTFYGPYTVGVRGIVKTQTIRGKWFVYAAQSSSDFSVNGLIANHVPSWVNP